MTPARRTFPVTKQREDKFIEAVEACGSDSAASSLVRLGPSDERHGGLTTWRNHAQRNPEFALRWQAAKEKYQGLLEETIAKRVIEGTERPIFQQGRQVGSERRYSDELLLRALASIDPNKWSERRQVEMSGRTLSVGLHVKLDASDVMLFEDPEDRATFAKLLNKLSVIKGKRQREISDGSTISP